MQGVMRATCATTYRARATKPRGAGRCKAAAAKTAGPPANLERFRIETPWDKAKQVLIEEFGATDEELKRCESLSDEDLSKAYYTMQLCRDFENECNQAYMAGKIRGFMHLDNGQESIPALLADSIRQDDLKHSYYRDHCHALACGVDSGAVMAELFGKDGGTCRGTGGSMHVYDCLLYTSDAADE